MTENLLQKLEEKMMLLVSEIEQARKEIESLKQENSTLKSEKEKHANKLHELLSLIDTIDMEGGTQQVGSSVSPVKPVLISKENIAS